MRNKWPLEYIMTIGISAVTGLVVAGPVGGVVGAASGILDEYLIDQGLEDKHYLSSSLYWGNVLYKGNALLGRVFPTYKWFFYTSSLVLSPLVTHFSDDFLDFKVRIDTPLESFFAISKLFSNKDGDSQSQEVSKNEIVKNNSTYAADISETIQHIINNKFLVYAIAASGLKLGHVLIEQQFLKYVGIYGQGLLINNLLSEQSQNAVSNMLKKGVKVASIFMLKKVVDLGIRIAEIHITRKQYEIILERSTQVILESNNARKLLSTEEGKEILNNFVADIYTLMFQGVYKLNEQVSSIIEFVVGQKLLSKIAPDAVLPYSLSFLAQQSVSTYFTEQSNVYEEEMSFIRTKLEEVKAHIFSEVEGISLRDGQNFMQEKYNRYLVEKSSLDISKTQLNYLKIISREGETTFNNYIDIFYFGYKVLNSDIELGKLPIIKRSLDQVFKFLSGNIIYHMESVEYILAKERIEAFFRVINDPVHPSVIKTVNEQEKILIKNYTLYLDSQKLLQIDNLELLKGKHYAFTGKSGCGKTSLLMDIKEGLCGTLTSSGIISMPENKFHNETKVVFINQGAYIPIDSTLLEAAYFPKILSHRNEPDRFDIREQVINLLVELEIDGFIVGGDLTTGLLARLDSKEFKLSGGQSKKIAVIQAILEAPDILIADEVMSGLDARSVVRVQQVLVKYLPDALIISVEHHAEDNNYDGFYDLEVHFSKEYGVIISEMASKSSQEVIRFNVIESNNTIGSTEVNICPAGEESLWEEVQ